MHQAHGRLGVAVLSLFSVTTVALGGDGQSVFDWINPQGGAYSDAANWSPLGPPSFFSTIRFDLDASYQVTAETILVSETMVGRDDVAIDAYYAGKGGGYAGLGELWIGGGIYDVPRTVDSPGSLAIVGDTFANAATIRLGSGLLASRLILESGAETSAAALLMTEASSLVYRLDDNTGTSWPILEVTQATSVYPAGALQVGDSTNGSAPPIGAQFELLHAYGYLDVDAFPFISLEPRPGRAYVIDRVEDKSGASILATVAASDTVATFNLAESDDLAESPNRLVAEDLDADGRDDLVVLLPSGIARVYPSTPSGFAAPVDYEVGPNPVDAAAGDFDGDGTVDLAIGCQGSSTLEYLLNPFGDATQLQPGPFAAVDGDVRSLATTVIPTDIPSLAGLTGVSVTANTSGGGKTRGYTTDGTDVVQVAEIEVGDDPGPSDPIDDENKKDPDPPIGVGGMGAAQFARGVQELSPILTVIEPSFADSGYSVVATFALTGRAVDFASADFDQDGFLDTLVVTANGHLDLLRPDLPQWPVHSIHLDGTPTSIAVGDLDGDATPEIVIGLADPPRLELHRAVLPNPELQGGPVRLVLERYSTEFLSQVPVDVVVADAADAPASGEVVVGLDGDGGGTPSVNVNQVETVKTPDCVYADFNGDGEVDAFDMTFILGFWGPCQDDLCPFDLNGDGFVNSPDLGLLMADWGDCLP